MPSDSIFEDEIISMINTSGSERWGAASSIAGTGSALIQGQYFKHKNLFGNQPAIEEWSKRMLLSDSVDKVDEGFKGTSIVAGFDQSFTPDVFYSEIREFFPRANVPPTTSDRIMFTYEFEQKRMFGGVRKQGLMLMIMYSPSLKAAQNLAAYISVGFISD